MGTPRRFLADYRQLRRSTRISWSARSHGERRASASHQFASHNQLVTAALCLPGCLALPNCFLEDFGEAFVALRRSEGTGRPVGAEEFVIGLERLLRSSRAGKKADRPAKGGSLHCCRKWEAQNGGESVSCPCAKQAGVFQPV